MNHQHLKWWPIGLAFLIASSLSHPSAANAQSNVAEAEKLFNEGRALMDAKEYDKACEAFEASQRADPAPSTLLNLADCREKNGQLATAWGLFLRVKMDTAGVEKLKDFHAGATLRADRLAPRVSYLIIAVPDESRVPGLVITRDGEEIDSSRWNQSLPIDGGNHEIVGKAPGHEAWSTIVTVEKEKDHETVTVPKFKEAIREAVDASKVPDDAGDNRPSRLEASPLTPWRKAAIAIAGGSVLMVTAGVVLGSQAESFEREVVDMCPMVSCDSADAANLLAQRARRRALLANVSFVAAGAALATSVVLWLTQGRAEPDPVAVVPHLAPDVVGLSATGRF